MLKKGLFTSLILVVLCILLVVPSFAADTNIVKNGGFEALINGVPSSWNSNSSVLPAGVTCAAVTTDVHSGTQSLKITNSKPADTMFVQNVTVQPDKLYKLTYWLKTENISNKPGSPNITLFYGDTGAKCQGITSTQETQDTAGKWLQVVTFFQSLKGVNYPLSVALRLGGQGTVNQGSAFFDDISLQQVDKADPGFKTLSFYVPGKAASPGSPTTSSSSSKPFDFKVLFFIILGIAALALLIFVEVKLSKRSKSDKAESVEGAEDSDDTEDRDDIDNDNDAETVDETSDNAVNDEKEEKEDSEDKDEI